MIKKSLFILLGITFVTSCSRFAYSQLADQVYEAVIGYDYQAIDRDEFNNTKYSFAIAQVGKTNPVKLILASVEGDTFKWISADRIIIHTKNGIIIKTEGLMNDFFSVPMPNNLQSISQSKHYVTFHSPELNHFQRYDTYRLIESKVEYEYLINEYITEAPLIKWTAQNKLYKRSDTGEVIAIEQKFHPHHPELKLYYYLK